MASDAESSGGGGSGGSGGSGVGRQQRLTDEELQQLIMQAYEDSADLAQLQLSMRGVMIDDPERIRQAYVKVVQMKGGARVRSVSEADLRTNRQTLRQQPQPPPRPSLILVDRGSQQQQQRRSQRRRSSPGQQRGGHRKAGGSTDAALSAVMDASAFKEVAGSMETLRSELAALCRVRHQNLLCLNGARPGKAGHFTLEFDLARSSHVTLLELFREAGAEGRPLNGCEIACVLAQACLGLLFLTDSAAVVLRNVRVRPELCLLTRNILLTSSGLIKLCGHHPVLQLPRTSTPSRAIPPSSILEEEAEAEDELDDLADAEPDSGRSQPGQLAHRLAQLLYELDHTEHRPLRCLADCSPPERKLLDERYAQLFGLCSDWDVALPLDLRRVLHSNFINEQTSSIDSYQMPLELVFAARPG